MFHLWVFTFQHQRLVLGTQRNSAISAMWSEDHSGDGRAVSFLKLSSSSNSNNDSTVSVSAETRKAKCLQDEKQKKYELQSCRHWVPKQTCVKYVIKCAYKVPGTVGKQRFIWCRIQFSPLLLGNKAASPSCKRWVSTDLQCPQGKMSKHCLSWFFASVFMIIPMAVDELAWCEDVRFQEDQPSNLGALDQSSPWQEGNEENWKYMEGNSKLIRQETGIIIWYRFWPFCNLDKTKRKPRQTSLVLYWNLHTQALEYLHWQLFSPVPSIMCEPISSKNQIWMSSDVRILNRQVLLQWEIKINLPELYILQIMRNVYMSVSLHSSYK